MIRAQDDRDNGKRLIGPDGVNRCPHCRVAYVRRQDRPAAVCDDGDEVEVAFARTVVAAHDVNRSAEEGASRRTLRD